MRESIRLQTNAREEKKPLLTEETFPLALQERLLATTHVHLGSALEALDDHHGALDEYRAAFEFRKRQLGECHREVAGVLSQMASAYEALGDRKGARRTLEAALQAQTKAHGERFIGVGLLWGKVGLLHLADEEFAEALGAFERNLAACREALPQGHSLLGSAWQNTGAALAGLGRQAEALRAFTTALQIRRAALGERHADVGATLASLGLAYSALGRYDDAQESLGKALPLLRESGQDVAKLQATMAGIAMRQGANRLFGADGFFTPRATPRAGAETAPVLTPRSHAAEITRPPQSFLAGAEETAQAFFGTMNWSARSVNLS